MTKTAEQKIREWVEAEDTDAMLDLNGFETIPELPDSVEILYASSVIRFSKLPASLTHLFAYSAVYFPEELPCGLRVMHIGSAEHLPKLPGSLKTLYVDDAKKQAMHP